jgi:hypothetical protein
MPNRWPCRLAFLQVLQQLAVSFLRVGARGGIDNGTPEQASVPVTRRVWMAGVVFRPSPLFKAGSGPVAVSLIKPLPVA